MSRHNNGNERRKLALKRETLRRLSARDLGRAAGGSYGFTEDCGDTVACAESAGCDTTGCWFSTGTRYC